MTHALRWDELDHDRPPRRLAAAPDPAWLTPRVLRLSRHILDTGVLTIATSWHAPSGRPDAVTSPSWRP